MYHYAGNNPVRYTDPTGEFAIPVIPIIIGLYTLLLCKSCDYDQPSSSGYSVYGDDDIYHLGNSYAEPDFSKKKKSDSEEPSPMPENGAESASPSPAPNGNNDNNNDDDESGEQNPQKEYKKPKAGSGKEKSDDIPSWVEGNRPYVDENGKSFAKRLMDEHYGKGNWSNKSHDYSSLKKYGDRGFSN